MQKNEAKKKKKLIARWYSSENVSYLGSYLGVLDNTSKIATLLSVDESTFTRWNSFYFVI